MAKSGNTAANAVFEAKLWEEGTRTPDRKDYELQDERLVFITKKYQNYIYFCEEAYWNFMDEKYPDHEIYHNNTLIRGSVTARLKKASLQWGTSNNDGQKDVKSVEKKLSPSFADEEDTEKITKEIQTLAKVKMPFLKRHSKSNLLVFRRSDTPAEGCVAQWRTSRSRQSLTETQESSILTRRRTNSMSNLMSYIPTPLIDMYMSDSETEDEDEDELVVFPHPEQLEGFVDCRDSIIGRIVSCETEDDPTKQVSVRNRSYSSDRKPSRVSNRNSESNRHHTERRSASTGRICRSRNTERRGKSRNVCGEKSASIGRISQNRDSKSPRRKEERRDRRHKRSASPKVDQHSHTYPRRVELVAAKPQDHLIQDISRPTTQNGPGLRRNSSVSLPSPRDAKPVRPQRRSTYKSDYTYIELSANSFVVIGCSPNDSNYWETMMNQWASPA